jgi:hypothetical protein
METNAKTLMEKCRAQGIDVYRYGADLVDYAYMELWQSTWAVRFLYWHILNGGLCLRPPWSMVEHAGFDQEATNASSAGKWAGLPLKPCPPLPAVWPAAVENPQCPYLWQKACGTRPTWHGRFYRFIRRIVWRAMRGRFYRFTRRMVRRAVRTISTP